MLPTVHRPTPSTVPLGPISASCAETAPARTRGLWSAGFLANRGEIAARLGERGDLADLELAADLYARCGEEAPRRLCGPFSWVLWDGERGRLVAVRDRLGVHPLYWARRGEEVLLAGEIGALLEACGSAGVNPRAVAAHLRGLPPPEGETFHAGIGAVPPGWLLTATGGRVQLCRYWRPEAGPPLRLPDDDAYGRAFREVFLPVVAEYAQGVPAAGVTLSGGLDSTAVAASLREAAPETALTAFSWSAPELPEADETAEAAAVCRRLGCPMVTIAADQHWPLRSEPAIRPGLEGPLVNCYADLWDATFQAAREGGTRVLFSGLSGDHLFGGDVFSYPDLLLTGRWWRLAAEIAVQRRSSELTLGAIVRWLTLAPIANAYLPGRRERDRTRPVAWLGERLRREAPAAAPEPPPRLLPGRRERLRVLRDPLLPALAALATAQAARHGVELRHPLLDHRLFDFAAALPATQTFSAGRRKMIVRRAMRGRLPEAVLERRGKIYPSAIAHRGLRERERAKVWALLTDMRAARLGYVDEPRLRAAYGAYLTRRTESTAFWHTLTLEAWLRRYWT